MRKLAASKKGNMPFAIIAVTILMIAGTYVSVCAYIERTEDNIDNLNIELDVFDETIDDIQSMINRGMGEIIAEISRTDNLSLMERSSDFDRRSDDWMTFQFPISNGTVTAELVKHNVSLNAESLRLLSSDPQEMAASMPVFLKATGTADIVLSSSSSTASRSLNISADGTSALPLVVSQSSLFELAVEGERSLLTQMISYQLAALAQYRVMQGFGSLSQYGAIGTESIITENDVKDAYRNAMDAIEMICFRTTSSENSEDVTKTDLAEKLVSQNGYFELDLAAIFAQTIASQIDELAGKWVDYFMGEKILEIIDSLMDAAIKLGETVYNALVSLKNFFTEKETPKITASNHLKEIMKEMGYSETDYRRLSSDSLEFSFPGGDYTAYTEDTELHIFVPSMKSNISYQDEDILSWNGWDSFLDDYRKETNAVRETISGVLNAVCIQLSSSYGLGTVYVPVDIHDGVSFSAALSEAINRTLSEQKGTMESRVDSYMRGFSFADPMYGTMFKKIKANADSLFGTSSVKGCIESEIRRSVNEWISTNYNGVLLDGTLIDSVVEDQMRSLEVAEALDVYDDAVSARMALFENVLNQVKDKGGAMKEVFSLIIKKGLITTDLLPKVEERIVPLCEEMAEHLRMNSVDIIDLPGVSEFTLSDGFGRNYTETISLTRTDGLNVKITSPSENHSNIHYIDLFSDKEHAAAFSASFVVSLESSVKFNASAYSSISKMLGISDSRYSGNVFVKTQITIPVISGWALAGVDYEPSNTIWKDIEESVKKILIPFLEEIFEPILKPLREFYRMADCLFNLIGSALVEFSEYVTSLIQKIYEKITGPIEKLQEMIDSLMDRFGESFEEIIKITGTGQEFGFRFYEFEMKIIMNAAEVYTKHKTVLKVEVSMPVMNTDIKVTLDIKRNEKKEYSFAGSASLTSDSWNLNIAIDPFMKIKKHIFEMTGTIRNTDIHVVMPELVQYEKLDFRLSDIPAIGTILSNIPIPIPGMKGTIDAGLELKYNLPYKHGLMINEFDSNPKGTDAGNEWVELYNSTSESINLKGYKIVAGSGDDKYFEIGDVTIGAMGFLIIKMPKQMLNNSVGTKGNGECLTLLDENDTEIDKTSWKSDIKDDEQSWQRTYDGSLEWIFKHNTKGEVNGGKILAGNAMASMIKQCVIDAAIDTFGSVDLISDLPGVADLLKKTIELAIKKIIESIASCVVEASAFFEIRATDVTGSSGAGIKIAVVIGPDIIEDGLRWIVQEIAGISLNIGNPSGLSPKTILSDDVYVRFTTFIGLSMPKFLGPLSNQQRTVGIMIQCNISAVCTLIGKETGTWNIGVGAVIENIPPELIPKMYKADKTKSADLWLIRGEFQRSQS